MDELDIIQEALYYPLNDIKGWGIIASIFIVTGILEQLAIIYSDYALIFHILAFIVSILLLGVNLTIIKETIDGGYEIPMLNPLLNVVDGLKNLVVNAVYYIIPAIMVFLISIVAGVYTNAENFILALNTTTITDTSAANLLSTVPSDITNALFISIGIVAISAFILFVIFELFLIIAQARLAETGDIVAALNIKEVINRISSIGWANYILFIILLLAVIFVIGFVSGIVSMIPYVGRIIASVVLDSYLLIVMARAVGLIYKETV